MLAEQVDIVLGVDTHKATHTAAVVRASGAVVDQLTVSADPGGYRALLALARQHAGRRVWAVEGTGGYGAGLYALLVECGETVVEVERPTRRARKAGAKSDAIDAVRADVLARTHQASPRARGEREAIGLLLTTRAAAVGTRTRALTALQAVVISAPEPLRSRLRHLSVGQLVRTCGRLRLNPGQSIEQQATVIALRCHARRAADCEREADELQQQLEQLVRETAPQLLDQLGVGPIVAAQLIASWSHRGRLHSEAAFAALAGVAPIPASSGQTVRHRLNRSGDRQLNKALHTVVLVRLRLDPETKAYAARRLAQGKSMREIKTLPQTLRRPLTVPPARAPTPGIGP